MLQLTFKDLDMFLAHPGGRKALEAVEEVCNNTHLFTHSYEVLRRHGNMFFATFLMI